MIEVIGVIAILAGLVVLLYGLGAVLGWINWRIRWYWGDAHQLKRSVKLGWNTGMPPENKWFIVREYAQGAIGQKGKISYDYEWALMKRIGDTCYTVNGGMSTPARNITGWLYVIEGDE